MGDIPETVTVWTDEDTTRWTRVEGQLRVTFRGVAYEQIDQLARELRDVGDPGEVVVKGVTILLMARGHEMILRDKESGESIEVDLWR